EPGDLRGALAEVHPETVARLPDGRPDRDVGGAVAVVVEDRFSAVHAVAPGPDARAGPALRAVQDLLDRPGHRLHAVLVHHAEQTPLPQPRRADGGTEIAQEVPRMADVGRDHLHHVVPDFAGVVEL